MKRDKKYRSAKLDSETLNKIWDASKPFIHRNKKKYSRKRKKRIEIETVDNFG